MRRSNMVVLASLVLTGTPAAAAAFSYSCVVDHFYDALGLPQLTESDIGKAFRNSQFEVSRSTGEIVGDILTTSGAESTRVMDRGSKAMSFKAVAIFTGHVQILEIKEFTEGSEKPFIALSLGGLGVYTGVCKSPNGQIRHHSSDRIVGNVGAANKKGLPIRKYGKSGVHIHWTTSHLLEELYVSHVRNIHGNFL